MKWEYQVVKTGDMDCDLQAILEEATEGWRVAHPILDNGYTTGWLLEREQSE